MLALFYNLSSSYCLIKVRLSSLSLYHIKLDKTAKATEPQLTRGQNIISLQNACRCQIVDDILQTNVFEDWTKRSAFFCIQEGLFLTQVCRAKPIRFRVKQPTTKKDCTCRSVLHKEWFTVPVLRLQSQASASARSCLMGPSQERLSCRNIHCRERKLQMKLLETSRMVQWVYLGVMRYKIIPCTFFRAV